jgi:hypothetical protein
MLFRIHRMKEAARESFRWAPHTGGLAIVKPKDYDLAGDTEGATVYGVWSALRQGGEPLRTGDILEDEAGKLWVAKYIGFENAQWWVAEVKAVVMPQAESMQAQVESMAPVSPIAP